jgi:hypothetical protein
MAVKTTKKCRACGVRPAGKGGICSQCFVESAVASRKVPAPKRQENSTGPVCPNCRAEVSWDKLGTSETEVTIYVREKMYFCSRCRALLGFSSWHTEG